ncbi:transporter [Chitinophagaceae bacterium LWZ2-11]
MIKIFSFVVLTFVIFRAMSQELEPRAYANLPKGTNAIAAVYSYSFGNVLTDPSLPIKDADLRTHNIGLGYVRTFGLANKIARVQLSLPVTFLAGKATVNNTDTELVRTGLGDARLRFGINLSGSPALDKKDFRKYKQQTIVGLSLVISIPTGLYYKDKLINLGSHRWAFKPEIGVSRRFKHFFAEAYTGVWFYTENTNFLSVKTQKQEPVLSTQAHVSYYFKNEMWVGVDGNWFTGGKTIVNNVELNNLENNWRVGAVWSFPIAKQQSLKLQFHVGAFTNTGYHYSVLSLAYQYVFF